MKINEVISKQVDEAIPVALAAIGGAALRGAATGAAAQAGSMAINALVGKSDDTLNASKRPRKNKKKSLPESTRRLLESGSIDGVGAIHIDEIPPTLEKLQSALGIDLMNNVLGSVGKKEFSGDIDVALKIEPQDIPAFMERLEASPLVTDISKSSVIMTKVKIEKYDQSIETDRPRTGYVQVDFMPGDPDWLKTYYHSPHEKDTRYKGAHRTVMLAIIAAVYQQNNSQETTDDGRPLESERWMFSPRDGLVRVIRTPVPKKNGQGYTKKNSNRIIGGPYKTADDIAHQLNLGTAEDLDSFETLWNAVQANYDPATIQRIKDTANSSSELGGHGVPDELK